jgi:hypothetical protein
MVVAGRERREPWEEQCDWPVRPGLREEVMHRAQVHDALRWVAVRTLAVGAGVDDVDHRPDIRDEVLKRGWR